MSQVTVGMLHKSGLTLRVELENPGIIAELIECLQDMVCKRCDHAWCDRSRQVIRKAKEGETK